MTKLVIADLGPDSKYYQFSFLKRPAEEFYDLSNHSQRLVNPAIKLPELTKKYCPLLATELKGSCHPRQGGPALNVLVPIYCGEGPHSPMAR